MHDVAIKFAWKRAKRNKAGYRDTVKRYVAKCRCGWEGPERSSHAEAENDEFEHRVTTGEE